MFVLVCAACVKDGGDAFVELWVDWRRDEDACAIRVKLMLVEVLCTAFIELCVLVCL